MQIEPQPCFEVHRVTLCRGTRSPSIAPGCARPAAWIPHGCPRPEVHGHPSASAGATELRNAKPRSAAGRAGPEDPGAQFPPPAETRGGLARIRAGRVVPPATTWAPAPRPSLHPRLQARL